jgi:heme/copper-type cytochrome/quinol oxidase subunit 4
MLKGIKNSYHKSFKPTFFLKIFLTVIAVIIFVNGIVNNHSFEHIKWLYWTGSLMGLVAGVEDILQGREKWSYISNFGLSVLSAIIAVFFS